MYIHLCIICLCEEPQIYFLGALMLVLVHTNAAWGVIWIGGNSTFIDSIRSPRRYGCTRRILRKDEQRIKLAEMGNSRSEEMRMSKLRRASLMIASRNAGLGSIYVAEEIAQKEQKRIECEL